MRYGGPETNFDPTTGKWGVANNLDVVPGTHCFDTELEALQHARELFPLDDPCLTRDSYHTGYRAVPAGTKGGPCNRSICRAPDAQWWNSSTQAYYCAKCAYDINTFSMLADRVMLCTLGEGEPSFIESVNRALPPLICNRTEGVTK